MVAHKFKAAPVYFLFHRLLMASEPLKLFDKVRIYLDEDYSSAEKFTALGSFYFVHQSLTDVLTWDFKGEHRVVWIERLILVCKIFELTW